MGASHSTPKTEKSSEDGENDRLRFGLAAMQGWRATMDDAVSRWPTLISVPVSNELYKYCYHYFVQNINFSVLTMQNPVS